MRFSIVKEIFKKEVLELLRDKKNLFMMFILPLLMYPLITVGISQVMMASMDSMGKQEVRLLIDDKVDEDIYMFIKNSKKIDKTDDYGQISIYRKSIDESGIKKEVKNETYDIALAKDKDNKYKIYIDTRSDKAQLISDRISGILDEYKDEKIEKTLKNSGLNPEKTLNPITYTSVSVAESQEEAGGIIGRIIPFMLIVGILSGAVYPAADMIAGEKERGTLETLLTMPIKNIELIAGKYASVAFTAIVSALINLLSMGLTTYYFYMTAAKMMGGINLNFDVSKMFLPILITLVSLLVFTLVISALSMCVCSFAKNYKQAQGYLTPLMLVTMIPAYASMIPMLELNTKTAIIPVVNVVMLIKAVFFMDVNMKLAGLVLLSNLAFIVIALVLLAKIFKSEEILFGGAENISILNARRNIKKNNLPSVSDGILIFAIELVYLLTLGSYIQVSYGTLGILLSQVLLLAIVLVYSWYIKADFRKVFSLNKINLSQLGYGLLLWMAAFLVMMVISWLILQLSPSAQEMSKKLGDVLFGDNIFLNVITVAMAPAICEEALFRGFILTAFSNKKSIKDKYDQIENEDPIENKKESWDILGKKYSELTEEEKNHPIKDKMSTLGLYKLLDGDKAAIVFSGILFGIMHLYWFKIPATAILGIFLAIGVKRTNSIGSSVLGHFCNNLVSLIVSTLGVGLFL